MYDNMFLYDTKTGDMILYLDNNHTSYERLRRKFDGSDLDHKLKKSKLFHSYSTDNYVTHDPRNEYPLSELRGKLKFSISNRSNSKRKFHFYNTWGTYPKTKWVTDPANPTKKNPYGPGTVANGTYISDWDDPQIRKDWKLDKKWNSMITDIKVYY